ncbi:MAG: hypothetical protein JWL69_385 [Phycisphaerales bacterium]|nr:hypothetical protein [Phycisphaerales bacterium]
MRWRTVQIWTLLAVDLITGALVGGCHKGDGAAGPSVTPASDAGPQSTAQASATRMVGIDNFSFSPDEITVPVGTTVTWVNHDDVPHTVTSVDKRFASPALDTDGRFSQTFTAPGTYAYYCAVHQHMTGKVIVK